MGITDLRGEWLAAKRALFEKYYGRLNGKQREAVFTVNGPVLILAGAGSGKTTVLVERIGYIIRFGNAYMSDYMPSDVTEEDVARLKRALDEPEEEIAKILPSFAVNPCPEYRMMAFTFTNKAASEIKARLGSVGGIDAGFIWAGTFHHICMLILRVHAEKLGYKEGFTVYDADDSKKAIKEAMKAVNADERMLPDAAVIRAISRAKDNLMDPELYERDMAGDLRARAIAQVYRRYQADLKRSNAMDFDDIIMQTVLLLRTFPEVADYYRARFRYLSVDEFQDTNIAQFALIRELTGPADNLMVVGDDDQSIYRFRGATIENILSFDKVYKESAVIRLEQNYRSTSNILDAANAVIAKNRNRHEKSLWTERESGTKVQILPLPNQDREAGFIMKIIKDTVGNGGCRYGDFAILVRTNALCNYLEQHLIRAGVPYRMIGTVRFNTRKEIQDIRAYLSLLVNPDDDQRLLRIVNEPSRKIGAKTLAAIMQIAQQTGQSCFAVMQRADDYEAIPKAARESCKNFTALIGELRQAVDSGKRPDEMIDLVADMSGYRAMLEQDMESGEDRLNNIMELKSTALSIMQRRDDKSLSCFLEELALQSDVDNYDSAADAVVLMTVHSAKGLEFRNVFLPAMEDGIFPNSRALLEGSEGEEEERRLAYVAMTRAKDNLVITYARERMLYGQTSIGLPSVFLADVPDKVKTGPAELREDRRRAVPGHAFPARQKEAEKPVAKPKSEPIPKWREGDAVVHPAFGKGEILSVRPAGPDSILEVVFETAGTKKLMASAARLRPASE
ncbi:MAG: UvrD-helicase domain-containing protein [Clostridia bacterium]|nr:UvrD-helicase domain-containing protein [Clostridia bacterium]